MAAPQVLSRTPSTPVRYVSLPLQQVAATPPPSPGTTYRAVNISASDPSALVPQLQAMFKGVQLDNDAEEALSNLCKAIEAQGKPKPAPKPMTCASILFDLVTLFVVIPALIILSNIGFGALLAQVEGWSFTVGLEYVIAITCGLANPIGASGNVVPTTSFGMSMCAIIGLQTLGLVGIIGGWAANCEIVNKAMSCIMGCGFCAKEGGVKKKFLSTIFIVFIIGPLVTKCVALVNGILLAWVEQWFFLDGYFYILADVAGLPDPLVNNSPQSVFGMIFDVLISIWCFVISSTIIGIASSAELPSCTECCDECCEKDDEDGEDEEEEGLLQ